MKLACDKSSFSSWLSLGLAAPLHHQTIRSVPPVEDERLKMLKHCQSLSSESRGVSGQGTQASSPPPLPPRFALCTDTISLSSSSSRSSSPAISDIVLETNFPAFAPINSPPKCSPSQRRIIKPFLTKPHLVPKTPSLKESPPSQKTSMLGGRSCSFLVSNTRVEQDKDRGSPVLVQCRWFDSPVPSLDKTEMELERKPSKVRHSVHFGEEDTNCDHTHTQTDDKTKTKEEESNKMAPYEVKPNTCNTNTVPIIKVAKVTQLTSEPTEVLDTNNNEKAGVAGPVGVTLKVYARCLAPDIEYKTVIVSENMTSRDLVWLLLSKCRMKHRDPKLFYLTMDVTVKKTGIPIKRTMVLDDDARPAQLRSCNPWGECKFSMQMKKGGLVRVYDSVLVAELKYKCLLISDDTTVEDVIRILLNCYGFDKMEEISRFCIYESGDFRERKLNKNEKPLSVQSHWSSSSHYQRFILRRATRSVSNQFPEETCVDDNDRELLAQCLSLYWSGYSTTDSEDSTCDGEVENAFQPISIPPVRQSNPRLLESLYTPTPVSLSKLLAATSSQELSLFTSLPALLDCRPISVLDSVDRIGKEMQVNIINRPYIGSLSNSVGSDIPSEQSGEHFFYI